MSVQPDNVSQSASEGFDADEEFHSLPNEPYFRDEDIEPSQREVNKFKINS